MQNKAPESRAFKKIKILKGKFMNALRLTSKGLADRWDVKESTLSQWRWFGKGPPFLKLFSLVLYRLEDIEKFEALALQHQKNGLNDEIFSEIRVQEKE